mmetsp:Transcript_39595/g.60569  ORF Transcript_39595/g.60569 Transcript_39595/m.60569 type:complete len:88 (-) Transcript_39595:6669-6932(-)
MRGVHDITIYTASKDGNKIDEFTKAGFNPLLPALLSPEDVILLLENPQVASFSDLKLRITHRLPVPEGSLIKVTVPSQVKLAATQSS